MAASKATSGTIDDLLGRYGRTYASELGIDVSRNTPSPLFRLLCASLLFSARISADVAISAARALTDTGWTTAPKMAASTWEARTKILNAAGYARYDESTSRMLGDTAAALCRDFGGDLRQLRQSAQRDPEAERRLLQEFKGIGGVGADIFLREVQVAWDELYPFADKKVLRAAKRLRLGDDAQSLARHVPKKDFARLATSLVRVDLANAYGDLA